MYTVEKCFTLHSTFKSNNEKLTHICDLIIVTFFVIFYMLTQGSKETLGKRVKYILLKKCYKIFMYKNTWLIVFKRYLRSNFASGMLTNSASYSPFHPAYPLKLKRKELWFWVSKQCPSK
uniref:Uncharacterized protein n=2 Tax=Schistocephalus solidus TaxID=70667 RepID=A0A0X3NM64_SCHSO